MKKSLSFQTFFTKHGVLCLAVISFVVFSLASEFFCNMRNVNMMLVNRVAVGFFAVACVPILAAGEFDISLGYQLGLTIMLGAWIGQYTESAAAIILFTICMSALLGAFKAFVVVNIKIPSIIATLGISTIYYGGTFVVSGGATISNCVPAIMKTMAKTKFLGINVTVWLFIAAALITYYLLEHTPFGKHLYAVGMSQKVSSLAGVRTKAVRFMSFVISGVLIGICGVVLLAQSGQGYTTTGPSYMLPGMSLAFFGITTHKTGIFNVPGVLLCWLLLSIVFNGISLLGAQFWLENLIYAVIMMVVVLTTTVKERIN